MMRVRIRKRIRIRRKRTEEATTVGSEVHQYFCELGRSRIAAQQHRGAPQWLEGVVHAI